MVTFQKKVFPTHANSPKICYRNITEQGDPEYVQDQLGKENWYRNHFILPDEQREFFGDSFDIDL